MLPSIPLIFCQFQPGVAYKNVIYKKTVYIYLDKQCITQHEDFGAVALSRNVKWTALVGLRDRESRGLPLGDSISSR